MSAQKSDDTPVVLTIAGTDPSGGAGINADLQVFRDFGCHGTAVIAAVVWQNTQQIGGWRALETSELGAQLDAVGVDFELAAVKIGMIPTGESVREVARFIGELSDQVSVVLDPVMVGGRGERALMDRSGRKALDILGERVDLITPNGPEARKLLAPQVGGGPEEWVQRLLDSGWRRVLLKGGHLRDDDQALVVDWYGDESGVGELEGLEPVSIDVHGTGCQLSSAIAAGRARRRDWTEAVDEARAYLHRLLREQATCVGRGRPIVVRAGSHL